MASNDATVVKEAPSTGPVAFLERIVRLPAINDQTPLRIVCMVLLAATMAATPMPFQVIGFVTLVVLALSLGHIRK